MEIPLFQDDDETMRFERIVLYPYPDLKRIWTRIWLTAVQDQAPNVELRVLDMDGSENNSVYMMARTKQRLETTLHMRDPEPGGVYQVEAELSLGFGDDQEVVDQQTFELVLEFRDPDQGDPGFGIGVDWDELKHKKQEE